MSQKRTPYIIAEIASAHEGSPDLALAIAQASIKAGADAVKFQIFKTHQLLSRYNPKFEEFGEIEIKPEQWKKILNEIANADVDIIVEPYDLSSFELAKASGGVDAHKVPTANIGDIDFLERIGKSHKPVYLGVGGAQWEEIERAVSILKETGDTPPVLMCGFQDFPTRLEDSKLFQIQKLRDAFGCPVGYADHVDAEDGKMARMVPALAIAAGATVIEKHITDDRTRKGRDHYSALNPDEFMEFVRLMRMLPIIMGDEKEWVLTDAEKQYRNFTKRQAVATRDIAAGASLSASDVVFKRIDKTGLSPGEISGYLGKVFSRAKKADEPLVYEDFSDG